MRFRSGSTGNGDGTETQGRKSLRERAIELATRYVVTPARRTLVFGAASYGLWRSRPLVPLSRQAESMRVKGLDDRTRRGRKPARVKSVAVNTQVQRIDKVAVDASFTRVGNEDVINVGFEGGGSVRAVLRANSIRRIYTRDNCGETKTVSKGDAVFSLKEYERITAVATKTGVRSGRGRPKDQRVDQIIFQASTGAFLIIEVEPGSIKRVEINDPGNGSENN